ncbi:MAG: hypothetical protein ACI35O_09045 [Bacillaceae bacterium]
MICLSLFFTALKVITDKGDEYQVNNVVYTGETYPTENYRGLVIGTFEDENGDIFKLFISREKEPLLEKGSRYNITYLMNSASQPNDNILSDWSVSSAKKINNEK